MHEWYNKRQTPEPRHIDQLMGHCEQHMQENSTQKNVYFCLLQWKKIPFQICKKNGPRKGKLLPCFLFCNSHFPLWDLSVWALVCVYICCGIANVPFQLRCERQTKWKNGAPSLDVQQKNIYKRMCLHVRKSVANIVDSVCWHLIIYKSICKCERRMEWCELLLLLLLLQLCGAIRVLCHVHILYPLQKRNVMTFVLMQWKIRTSLNGTHTHKHIENANAHEFIEIALIKGT